jgi:hypothetical protein
MTSRWVRDHPPSNGRRRSVRGLHGGHAAVGALGVLALVLLVTWLTLDGHPADPSGMLPTQPGHASTDDAAGVHPVARAAARDPVQSTVPAFPDAGSGLLEDPAAAAGLSPADLIALRAELTSHPRGEAELRRVLAFLTYQQQWQRFESQRRSGTEAAALRPLAVALDAALAERWQQGELGGAQALQIKAQLLEVLLDDAASRRSALAAWQAQLGIGAPDATSRRQAALEQTPGDRR